MKIKIDDSLLGKCGFYCGACPTFITRNCAGCLAEHTDGDCFTRDCVLKRSLDVCGQCPDFPCDELLARERATVLDKSWLQWKKNSNTNRG